MLNLIVEQKVAEHPFTTLEELRKFIDQVVDSMWASGTGRNPETIRQGHSTRASI